MANSKNIYKANEEVIERATTIDTLTKETETIKKEIKEKGEQIKQYAVGILKNLATKKIKTTISTPNEYGSKQFIVFSNYGFGVQHDSKYSTNATSFNEMRWKEFIQTGILLSQSNVDEWLKKDKAALLEKFTQDFEKLKIDRTEQEYILGEKVIIKFISDNLLSSKIESSYYGYHDEEEVDDQTLLKKARIEKLLFHKNTISFKDTKKNKIKVSTRRPKLRDALILEQIFDEAKDLLEREIVRLNIENKNYDEVIANIKNNFKSELLLMELAK